MEFYFHEVDRAVLVLRADGGLNRDTAAEFVAQLESLIDAGLKDIIVDCTNLSYISSYGIGVLMRLRNRLAKHGGDIKVAAPPGAVLHALTMTRIGDVLGIYEDVNRARLAFRPKNSDAP